MVIIVSVSQERFGWILCAMCLTICAILNFMGLIFLVGVADYYMWYEYLFFECVFLNSVGL